MDLGPPVSYLVLADGTRVLSSDDHDVGTVAHVLADADVDVFEGLVLDTPAGWRYADAGQIESMHERGVRLALSARDVERLPEPREAPAAMSTGADDTTPDDLGDRLRRAWDWISGNY